jgi:hypothetical protein
MCGWAMEGCVQLRVMRLSTYGCLGALVLSLAACGGGGDDDREDGSGGSKVTPPKSGEGGKDSAGASGKDSAGEGGKASAGESGSSGSGSGGEAGNDETGGTGGMDGGGSGGSASMVKEPNLPADMVTAGGICNRLAQILCAAEADCCTDPGREVAACETEQKATCNNDFMADAVAKRSEANFDADQAFKVFTKLDEMALACDPLIASFSESEEGLRSMFQGTKDPGDGCTPQNALDKPMSGGSLASCKDLHNYACLPNAIGWTCEMRAGEGSRCYSDLNCTQGLYCNNPKLRISGDTCHARKADGSSCELFNECESLYCRGGKCVPPDMHTSFCFNE